MRSQRMHRTWQICWGAAYPIVRPLVRTLAVGAVLGGVTLTCAGADIALPGMSPTASAHATAARAWSLRQSPPIEVVKRVKAAVVNIHSERTVRAPRHRGTVLQLTPSQSRVNGMGTGIIIDPRGYIVTNQHVVEDVTSSASAWPTAPSCQRPRRGPRCRGRPGPAQDRRRPARWPSCRWAPPAI